MERQQQDIQALVERYGASIPFDHELALDDICGSLAHAAMLTRAGVLSEEDGRLLQAGLKSIAQSIRSGSFIYQLAREDIHMNIEQALAEQIGTPAGRLHTARSRNDQVALDMRLYLRRRTLEILERLSDLQRVLAELAARHLETIVAGYTHMQRAQPVLLAHHLLAYGWMVARDAERLRDGFKRINRLPLGAGALAGTSFPLDREHTAQLLAFDGLCENSMDAVSDRDFVVEFLAAAALCAAHISRLGEELVLWSSAEFGFITMNRAFCTGSSMMPQKRNPDMAELARGKTGRVYGALIGMLTVLKGLPLTYNKDLQEDKEGVFDAARTLIDTLSVVSAMIETVEIKADVMRSAADGSYANATDLADYLTRRGVPFREAHGAVKRLVEHALEIGKPLDQFALAELREFAPAADEDVYAYLNTAAIVAVRRSRGGTARVEVEKQLERFTAQLDAAEAWRSETAERLKNAESKLWE